VSARLSQISSKNGVQRQAAIRATARSTPAVETKLGIGILRVTTDIEFGPQAYIIGAQKSATTSLAFLMGQHPMVVLSEPKEPDFLTVNWSKGLDWYQSRFRRSDGILIDASVGYSMAPVAPGRDAEVAAPARAHAISPQAKLIYMVRDPADRCYSAYWHEVRAGREKRPLREAVRAGAYYVSASYYFFQLSSWLRYFSLDQILILRFSEFVASPQDVANRCIAFLGASPAPFAFEIGQPKNESFNYTSFGRGLQKLLGNDGIKSLTSWSSHIVPSTLKAQLKRALTTEIPTIAADDYAWLSDLFRDDAAAFERTTGIKPL